MNQVEVDRFLDGLEEADLPGWYDLIVDVGEMPYQANRSAVQALDLNDDREAGRAALEETLLGLDQWIEEMKAFADAADRIAKGAAAVLRTPEDDSGHDEDSDAIGGPETTDEIGGEG